MLDGRLTVALHDARLGLILVPFCLLGDDADTLAADVAEARQITAICPIFAG